MTAAGRFYNAILASEATARDVPPDQAAQTARELMTSPPFVDPAHRGHSAIKAEVAELYRVAYGDSDESGAGAVLVDGKFVNLNVPAVR